MKRQQIIKIKLNIIRNWGERLKASGLTISKLAELAKVSRQTIHNTLNGTRLPNLETINKIEDILNSNDKI